MKKIAIIIIALFPLFVISQNVKCEGTIKDTNGAPLEMANVIAFKKGTNFLQSYSITDNKGNYKLSLEDGETYSFKISYLGFNTKNVEIAVFAKSPDITHNFVLDEANESLNQVDITYEMPVKIVGDTIVYNSDSFTNGTEKKTGRCS